MSLRSRLLPALTLSVYATLACIGPPAWSQNAPGEELAAKADPIQAPFVPGGIRRDESPSNPAPGAAPGTGGTAAQPQQSLPPSGGKVQGLSGSIGLASTDAPEVYRVGPGDQIHIEVWQEPDASGDFKVGPAGTIQHYLAGEIGVADHTPAEIAEVVRVALMLGYLRDPRVSVSVADYQSKKVFIHGEIARPGVYALRGPTNLLKLLLDAGGPTRDSGNECTLLQVEENTRGEKVQSTTVMLDRLLVRGDLTQNRPVSDGDVIFVHPREDSSDGSFHEDDRTYFVLGEVKNPGAYKFKNGVSAMTAILEAGGFSDFARSNKTKLVRNTNGREEERIVKMGDVLQKGERSLDVDLEPGDVLVVPKSLF